MNSLKKIVIFILYIMIFLSCIGELQAEESKIPGESLFQLESEWTTQDGETIKLSKFYGKAMVISMLYTSCEYSCPITLAFLKNLNAALSVEVKTKIRYVLVSLDPEHDTKDRLLGYMKKQNLNPDQWTFLRGSPEDTREIAVVLGVKYKKAEKDVISHSNVIAVVDSLGQISYKQNNLGENFSEIVSQINKVAE